MTEPPNTEALLATVRENVKRIRDNVGFALAEKNIPNEPTWTLLTPQALDNIDAALDAIASELERLRADESMWLTTTSDTAGIQYVTRIAELGAELERVRAERDAMKSTAYFQDFAHKSLAAEARLDRAVEALRVICDIGETRDVEVARAALTEIEESP